MQKFDNQEVYSSLVLFRNELKNRTIYKYKFLGILMEMMYLYQQEPLFLAHDLFKINFLDLNSVGDFVFENSIEEFRKPLIEVINSKIEEFEKNIKKDKNYFKGWIN